MKLEKREITLNEADSIQDVFYMEKALLHAYSLHMAKAERKETRSKMMTLMGEAGQNVYLVADLMTNGREK